MTDPAAHDAPSDAEIEHQLRAGRSLEAPPEATLLRAMAVWRPRATAAPAAGVLARAAGVLVRRLQAALSHDTGFAPMPLPGLRAAALGTRQLLYSSDGHDIDLRISPLDAGSGAGWRVSGQVLGPVGIGQAVLRCGSWSATTAWDALCEFSFAPVPGGACVLLLQGADWDIEIGPIDLHAPG